MFGGGLLPVVPAAAPPGGLRPVGPAVARPGFRPRGDPAASPRWAVRGAGSGIEPLRIRVVRPGYFQLNHLWFLWYLLIFATDRPLGREGAGLVACSDPRPSRPTASGCG